MNVYLCGIIEFNDKWSEVVRRFTDMYVWEAPSYAPYEMWSGKIPILRWNIEAREDSVEWCPDCLRRFLEELHGLQFMRTQTNKKFSE